MCSLECYSRPGGLKNVDSVALFRQHVRKKNFKSNGPNLMKLSRCYLLSLFLAWQNFIKRARSIRKISPTVELYGYTGTLVRFSSFCHKNPHTFIIRVVNYPREGVACLFACLSSSITKVQQTWVVKEIGRYQRNLSLRMINNTRSIVIQTT